MRHLRDLEKSKDVRSIPLIPSTPEEMEDMLRLCSFVRFKIPHQVSSSHIRNIVTRLVLFCSLFIYLFDHFPYWPYSFGNRSFKDWSKSVFRTTTSTVRVSLIHFSSFHSLSAFVFFVFFLYACIDLCLQISFCFQCSWS